MATKLGSIVSDPDGAVDEQFPVVGGRSGREARLDLLLAEELANDPNVLALLLHCIVDRSCTGLPTGDPTGVTVRLNVDEFGPELDPACHGETDIEVSVSFPGRDRAVPILVEDKVWSPFRYLQPERYIARAETRNGAAVLVAPAQFVESHRRDGEKFHGRLTIEAIIEALSEEPRDARRLWRARLLRELIQPPLRRAVIEDVPTVAFTVFCTGWLASHALPCRPRATSLHTAGQGWLYFKAPRGLVYKASGWARKDKAGVDLYLANHGFTGSLQDLQRLLETLAPPAGFVATTDNAKKPNVVLRYLCDKVTPGEGRPAEGSQRERSVIEALEACKRAAEWVVEYEKPMLAGGVDNAH